MAEHLLDRFYDVIDQGYQPGESQSDFRRRIKGNRSQLETSVKNVATLQSQALGASASSIKSFIAPFPCRVSAVYASKHGTVSGTATATLVNRDASANSDKNPLSAANINMVGLATANEAESQALSATEVNLQLDTGDCLQCTFATAGGSQMDGGTVAIVYYPIVAVD